MQSNYERNSWLLHNVGIQMSSYFDVKYNFDYGVFAITKSVNFNTTQTLIIDVFGLFFFGKYEF